MKPTEAGFLGDATATPPTDGGRSARRASWFASPVRGTIPARGSVPIFSYLWPAVASIHNAVETNSIPAGHQYSSGPARNAHPGSQQEHVGAAAVSATTSRQLREGQDQHHAE